MERLKEFQELFFKHLKNLFGLLEDKPGKQKDLDQDLINQGRSEEERDTIRRICEDVDTECALMKEIMTSEKKPAQWMEGTIERELKEAFPDATNEEIEDAISYIDNAFEEEIAHEAEIVANQADVIIEAVDQASTEQTPIEKREGEEDQNHE